MLRGLGTFLIISLVFVTLIFSINSIPGVGYDLTSMDNCTVRNEPLGPQDSKPVVVNMQVDIENEEDAKYVHEILNKIESYGWITSVFVAGKFAEENQEIIKEIEERGHYIGIYGWENENLSLLDYAEQLEIINKSVSAVKKAVNKPKYIVDFKPQNLDYDDDTIKILQELGMKSITAFFDAEETFVKCPYAKMVGKVTFPYPVTTEFSAVPISDVKIGQEEVLMDNHIFNEVSFDDYFDYLKMEFDEHDETKDPMVIAINPSTADDGKLQALSLFLDYIDEKGGKVKPTATMTLLASYIPSLYIISAPKSAYPGETITVTTSFSAAIYCPSYYFRIYGRFENEDGWDLLAEHYHGTNTGTFSFSKSIGIPECNGAKYIIRVVGQGCSGTCWPTPNSYERMDETAIRLKNPKKGYFNTDIPGVDRYCPVSGGGCVELKVGDLLFRDMHPSYMIPIYGWETGHRNPFWHVGIYVGDGWVIEALGGKISKTVLNRVYLFDSSEAPWKGATTVIGFKGLPPCEEDRLRKKVIDTAYSYMGTPFSCNFVEFLNPNPGGETLQCAQLTYLAYKSIGYDIRMNIWLSLWPGIAPVDVYRRTSGGIGGIKGSGVLGHDSYSKMVDPPSRELWSKPIYEIYPNESVSMSLSIDPTISNVGFFLAWQHNTTNLNLTLYSPNGTIISDGNITHERNQAMAYEYYIIENPEPGNWTIDVTAINIPEGSENFTVTTYLASNLSFIPLMNYWYGVNQTVTIAANLSIAGTPVTGANITVEVYKPDNLTLNITLFDDRTHGDISSDDGIYTNTFVPYIYGYYAVIFRAQGTISGYPFIREVFADIETVTKTANFMDNYSDYGSDPNGDGLYDYLVLEAELNVTNASNYTVVGLLHNDETIGAAWNYTSLGSGTHIVKLNFEGTDICSHKVNGPYKLDIVLSDENGNQMDYRQNAYLTSFYNYTNFICGGKIRGFVTFNGIPVSDAYVSAMGPSFGSTTTDENGSYEITSLMDGIYNVIVSATGNLLDESVTVNVSADEVVFVNFTLQAGGIIKGTIKDKNNNTIPNVKVYIAGPVRASTITDAYGNYNITKLESGGYTIRIEPSDPNLMTASDSYVNIIAGQTVVRNFTLGLAGSIAGNITDMKGMGISNLIIYLSGYETARYRTDEDGYYVIPRLEAGTYTVNIDGSETDFADDSKTVNVVLGQTTTANFVLGKFQGGNVKGRIIYENGTGIASVRVVASDLSYGDTYTNMTGYYEIKRLLKGYYVVTAYPRDETNLVKNSTRVFVDVNMTATADIVLPVGGIIAGIVTYENGTGVYDANIQVCLYEHTWECKYDYTNETGYYRIIGLEAGKYTITASPPYGLNLVKNSTNANVNLGETTTVDIILPKGGILTGYVFDYNGYPVEDAEIYIDGPVYGYDYADEKGSYELIGLETGEYTLYAYPPYGSDLANHVTRINITAGEIVHFNITLQRGGNITGYVFDYNGDPVENAYIYAYGPDNDYDYDYTDENGAYNIKGLMNGTYNVTVYPPYDTNLLSEQSAVNVIQGRIVYLNFTLQKGGIVTGYIFDPNGYPIEDAEIYIDGPVYGYDYADEKGSYELIGLETGEYNLYVQPPYGSDLTGYETSINLTAGETVYFNITLQRPRTIYGYIFDSASNPLANVPVELEGEEETLWLEDKTNENGYFELTDLPQGLYELYINEEEVVDCGVRDEVFSCQDITNKAACENSYAEYCSGYDYSYCDLSEGECGYFPCFWGDIGEGEACYFTCDDCMFGINQSFLEGYTSINFDDENMINLTDDLEINVTLLKINAKLEFNASNFKNGDTVEANVTVTNNEAFNLTNWAFVLGVDFENETYYEELYFNLTPTNLLAGETKSHIFILNIPEDNIYPEVYVYGGIGNDNWSVISSQGILTALIYKIDEKEIEIHFWALPGDVNGDCVVNIFDLAKVGLCYGKEPEGFCEPADIYPPPNGNGVINIFDLATVGLNYGKVCPVLYTCCLDNFDETCFRATIEMCRSHGGAVMECIPTPTGTVPPRTFVNYTKINETAQSEFLKNLTRDVNNTKSNRTYTPVTYDCDDFADDLERNLTTLGYNATYTYYWCKGPPAFGHAVVDIHAPDGSLVFVEPQNGKIINLDFDNNGEVGSRYNEHINNVDAVTDDNCAIEVYDSAQAASNAGAPRD